MFIYIYIHLYWSIKSMMNSGYNRIISLATNKGQESGMWV